MRLGWWILGAWLAVATAADAAPPLEAYGRLPDMDNVAISPNGTLLAYETNLNDKPVIAVISLETDKLVRVIDAGDQKIRDIAWADDDHLLATISNTHYATRIWAPKQEWYFCLSFNVRTGNQIVLLGEGAANDSMNVVVGPTQPRTVDGRTLVYLTGIAFRGDQSAVNALYAVDAETNAATLIEAGTVNTLDWVIDQNGQRVARTDYDDRDKSWTLSLRMGNAWHQAFTMTAPIDTPDVEGITPDGEAILIAMPNGEEKQIRIADGAEQTATAGLGAYASPIEDPVTHRIIGSAWLDTATHYRFLKHSDQEAWDSIAGAFQGENVDLVSWSADRKRIVIRIDGKNDGAAYELIDLNAGKSLHLGSAYKAISRFDVAEVRLVTYAAADGFKIPAYLTLPPGKGDKNLPLIVLPHGGPAARDAPEFDWWSQALASRGYAVLQPEFRGSWGFGLSVLEAGFGEWGHKMQTDLSDGVRYLAKQGTIDPKRVCIVGASYGGYAALAGATLDRGVYRCAVSVSGVSDPHGIIKWEANRKSRRDSQTTRWWNRFLGVEDYGDSKLDGISPLIHAADADIPILLIHGNDDTVVPIAQSEDMADALKSAGKPVTFVRLDGEDHWLSRATTRLKMLTETVAFLEANDPPN